MKKTLSGRQAVGLAAAAVSAVSALAPAAAAAAAAATTAAPGCAAPQLSQPFLSAGDSNWYTLPSGETPNAFDGSGWTLTGGARVITARLADGTTGSVLDLPSGSDALSPTMCVTSDYTSARTMVRTLAGSGGVAFTVSYAAASAAGNPQRMGRARGEQAAWTLSRSMTLQPADTPGWQRARFALSAGGHRSEFQIYDFYVDPRMH
jgi:hypothetical protein